MGRLFALLLLTACMVVNAAADTIIKEWRLRDNNYHEETFTCRYGERIRLEGALIVGGGGYGPDFITMYYPGGRKEVIPHGSGWTQDSVTFYAESTTVRIAFQYNAWDDDDEGVVRVVRTNPTNLRVEKPVLRGDGSMRFGYVVGPPEAVTRDYVTCDLYYATGPSRDEIIYPQGRIASTTLELNRGLGAIHWKTVPFAQIPQAPLEARYIVAVIDLENRIPETREDDNVAAEALPNIAVQAPRFEKAKGALRFGYTNEPGRPGYAKVPVKVLMIFSTVAPARGAYDNVQQLAEEVNKPDSPYLQNPGFTMHWSAGKAADTIPVFLTQISGTPDEIKYAIVIVDPDDLIAESNEADNIAILELPDLRLGQIPAIMRNKRWNEGAALLSKWFSMPERRAKKRMDLSLPIDTKTITWSWLLNPRSASDQRHIDAFRKLTDPTAYETGAFKSVLKKRVRKLMAGGSKSVPLAPHTRSFPTLHESQLQRQDVRLSALDLVSKDIDAVDAALGNYSMYSVPVGTAVKSKGVTTVTITHVLVYVLDSFDFEDWGSWSSQELGYWEWPNVVTRTFRFGAIHAENENFEALRSATGIGGDFLVASDVKKVKLSRPVTISW